MPALIHSVRPHSIASEMELVSGDVLLTINDQPINDILDYQFYSQDDFIIMEVEKQNKEIWSLEINKDYNEEVGLEFAGLIFDRMKSCRNRCIFCFVDQLPAHMRKTLYVKDDDFRHSFINGNFITLTNLSEGDWDKIIRLRLSPLYVSVHCIQAQLRREMLQNPRAGNIKQDLQRLRDAGIQVHTQIVVCPGWNDGQILRETITELASLYPSVASVGIVPVGLTGHRHNLPPLEPVGAEMAAEIISLVELYQKQFRASLGKGFVYLADEFYLRAAVELPGAEYYDDYCQVENGIGLARILLDDFASLEKSLPDSIPAQEAYILTGQSAQPILTTIVARLNQIEGLTVKIISVVNRYFEGGVTVTGLLTGQDIIAALNNNYRNQKVILPEVVFRDGQDVLLDDVSLQDIIKATGADLRTVDGTAGSLINAIIAQ